MMTQEKYQMKYRIAWQCSHAVSHTNAQMLFQNRNWEGWLIYVWLFFEHQNALSQKAQMYLCSQTFLGTFPGFRQVKMA